jgi:hypothetical protein
MNKGQVTYLGQSSIDSTQLLSEHLIGFEFGHVIIDGQWLRSSTHVSSQQVWFGQSVSSSLLSLVLQVNWFIFINGFGHAIGLGHKELLSTQIPVEAHFQNWHSDSRAAMVFKNTTDNTKRLKYFSIKN